MKTVNKKVASQDMIISKLKKEKLDFMKEVQAWEKKVASLKKELAEKNHKISTLQQQNRNTSEVKAEVFVEQKSAAVPARAVSEQPVERQSPPADPSPQMVKPAESIEDEPSPIEPALKEKPVQSAIPQVKKPTPPKREAISNTSLMQFKCLLYFSDITADNALEKVHTVSKEIEDKHILEFINFEGNNVFSLLPKEDFLRTYSDSEQKELDARILKEISVDSSSLKEDRVSVSDFFDKFENMGLTLDDQLKNYLLSITLDESDSPDELNLGMTLSKFHQLLFNQEVKSIGDLSEKDESDVEDYANEFDDNQES